MKTKNWLTIILLLLLGISVAGIKSYYQHKNRIQTRKVKSLNLNTYKFYFIDGTSKYFEFENTIKLRLTNKGCVANNKFNENEIIYACGVKYFKKIYK